MRCGAVPILIALANADERAVTHIDGNEKLLACLGRHRTLTENHLIHVYVVVNGLEGLNRCPTATLKNDLRHLCAVALSKLLADIHVVEVVLHKGIVEVAKVTGERRLLGIELLLKRLDSRLNLGSSALGLVGADDLLALTEILLLAYVEVNGNLLVELSNLCAEITRSRVDNEILTTVLIHVNLYKVVAAAKRSE